MPQEAEDGLCHQDKASDHCPIVPQDAAEEDAEYCRHEADAKERVSQQSSPG